MSCYFCKDYKKHNKKNTSLNLVFRVDKYNEDYSHIEDRHYTGVYKINHCPVCGKSIKEVK